MNFKPKYIVFGLITFIIIFLMNYLGNDAPDKLSRALMTAFAAVIGLAIGMWFYKRDKNYNHPDFD